MKFTLEIKLGNAAMQTAEQVAYALNTVADTVEQRYGRAPVMVATSEDGIVRDVNGNTVGTWKVR